MDRTKTRRPVDAANRNEKPLTSRWEALLGPKVEDEIPAGFQSAEEVAKDIGLSVDSTSGKLGKMVEAGKVERRRFRRGNKVMWFYRIREKKR